MGYMIEITEDKVSEMTELAGKMLKYGSRLMECIDSLESESSHGRLSERSPMGDYRSPHYGRSDGWRDSDRGDDRYFSDRSRNYR